MKKIIAVLLLTSLCFSLYACSNYGFVNKSAEVELCTELQNMIIDVCKKYWDGTIGRDEAQRQLESIKEYMEEKSAIRQFRSIAFSSNEGFTRAAGSFINPSSERRALLKQSEANLESCTFENRNDREVKLAMQVQNDLLDVYKKYWNMDILNYDAGQEVSSILNNWKEQSKVLSFYKDVDSLFSVSFDSNYYLKNLDEANYYKQKIESYDFN